MRCAALVALLLPALALAESPEQRFAKLRDNAEPLSSVGAFVDKYVGDCASGGECAKNAEAFRRAANGKQYYMIITETTYNSLQVGSVNVSDGTFTLNLTPFFAGSNSAITHGAPGKSDANGNPLMAFIAIPSKMPEGWNPAMMQRQVEAQALRVQLVFTPQALWTLPKKGGGQNKGVNTRFDGVLVTVGRTGELVGAWFAKR
jgi:hypothetical protein